MEYYITIIYYYKYACYLGHNMGINMLMKYMQFMNDI